CRLARPKRNRPRRFDAVRKLAQLAPPARDVDRERQHTLGRVAVAAIVKRPYVLLTIVNLQPERPRREHGAQRQFFPCGICRTWLRRLRRSTGLGSVLDRNSTSRGPGAARTGVSVFGAHRSSRPRACRVAVTSAQRRSRLFRQTGEIAREIAGK